jgi:hypothetical protein
LLLYPEISYSVPLEEEMNYDTIVEFLRKRLPEKGLQINDIKEALSWGRTGSVIEHAIEIKPCNLGQWATYGPKVGWIDPDDLNMVVVIDPDYKDFIQNLVNEYRYYNPITDVEFEFNEVDLVSIRKEEHEEETHGTFVGVFFIFAAILIIPCFILLYSNLF